MSLLQGVHGPQDLRGLSAQELDGLAGEIRSFLVHHVSRTGGHLGPNLGVVELTIALHRVFDSPRDPLIFDTGHQSYVHKILTGRQTRFDSLRQRGGLSGYPARAESDHDWVENSHASTSLSWATGLASGFRLRGEDHTVVAIIGDGALTGGMAWEALNNIAARPGLKLVVVVNDNGRSYTPTVGGLAAHLRALRADTRHQGTRTLAFGLNYLGPVDGHDIGALEQALTEAKGSGGPVVVHAVTEKGKGFGAAELHEEDRFHAVGPMDGVTGIPLGVSPRTWTSAFSDKILALAERHPDVVAITAAMLHPTGLAPLRARYPDRVFDVGIAEQHAVTFAAGLARGGYHPFVAVYATFLNRAFDQVLMDVALHGLGVTFVLDRAGVTGPDGPSHHGVWDHALLAAVPGLWLAAPRDEERLSEALERALQIADAPSVVRFSKEAVPDPLPAVDHRGSVDILARAPDAKVLLVGYGQFASLALQVGARVGDQGIPVTVADPVWALPLGDDLLALCAEHNRVFTLEDSGAAGGVGALLAHELAERGLATRVRRLGIPRCFPGQGSRAEVLEGMGLTAQALARTVVEAVVSGTAPRAAGVAERVSEAGE